MIKKGLLYAPMCRDIVRRAGVRPGGTGSDEEGPVSTGGEPWEAITKLSETDYDVGWRKLGVGPEMGQLFNSGPPCNQRIMSFTYLRDSLLRSGTSNSSRFGYSFDWHLSQTAGSGAFFDRVRLWGERDWRAVVNLPLFASTRVRDNSILVAKDQARIIAYITKADFGYTFTLALARTDTFIGLDPSEYNTYDIAHSGTGRFISDWYDLPDYDASTQPAEWGYRPFGDATASVSIRATTPDPPSLSIPTTHPELREGTGPIGMPFLEVELRTVYYPESSYWIQDDYTPEDYRVAQWENEV